MDTTLVHEFLFCIENFHRTCERPEIRKQMMGEMLVLGFLYQHGQTTPGELSKAMHVSTARTAATLNSLEKKGLITRTPSSVDRRKTEINCTDLGVEVFSKGTAFLEQRIARFLELLGEADSRELIRILNRIIEIEPEFHLRCNPNQHTISPDRKE